jgi:hypothetical protein
VALELLINRNNKDFANSQD